MKRRRERLPRVVRFAAESARIWPPGPLKSFVSRPNSRGSAPVDAMVDGADGCAGIFQGRLAESAMLSRDGLRRSGSRDDLGSRRFVAGGQHGRWWNGGEQTVQKNGAREAHRPASAPAYKGVALNRGRGTVWPVGAAAR